MNMLKKIYILLLATIVSACSKTMELDALDFDASIAQETVEPGKEITFDLKGNANIVTFYSGEIGKDYQYREGRPLELSEPQVSFSSNANYGKQEKQLSVLVSTKFNGDYTPEGIKASIDAEEWTDITSEFVLSSHKGTNGNYDGVTVASGTFDLSNIITAEKKGLYFAYRNQVKPDAIGGAVTQWTMSKFLFTVNTLTGRQNLIDQGSAGWSVIMARDIDVKDPVIQATSVFFRRNDNRNLYLDNWTITKKIEFAPINLGPDVGEPIKSYADPQLTEFKYTYDVPGTYIATFLASNVNAEAEKKVVKQVKVTVKEPNP